MTAHRGAAGAWLVFWLVRSRPPLSVRDATGRALTSASRAARMTLAPALGAAYFDEQKPGGTSPMYAADEQASRPFAWFPLSGHRHAIDRRDRQVLVGEPMRCLCGAIHPRGADGDMEWLWKTCEQCWEETCRIVGLRPRQSPFYDGVC